MSPSPTRDSTRQPLSTLWEKPIQLLWPQSPKREESDSISSKNACGPPNAHAPSSAFPPLNSFPPLSQSQQSIRRKVDGSAITPIEFLQRIAMDIEPEAVRKNDPRATEVSMRMHVITSNWENSMSTHSSSVGGPDTPPNHHFDNVARKMEIVYYSMLKECRLENHLWDHERSCPRSNVNTDDFIKRLDRTTKMRLAGIIRDRYPEEHINERVFKINLVARYLLDTL